MMDSLVVTASDAKDHARQFMELIVLVGVFLMSVAYGIRRVYRTARNVEDLVDMAKTSRTELNAHINDEEHDIKEINKVVQDLQHSIGEIVREIRPNGGSSMKDTLNDVHKQVTEVHTRVSVLEQWKEDTTHPIHTYYPANKE